MEDHPSLVYADDAVEHIVAGGQQAEGDAAEPVAEAKTEKKPQTAKDFMNNGEQDFIILQDIPSADAPFRSPPCAPRRS